MNSEKISKSQQKNKNHKNKRAEVAYSNKKSSQNFNLNIEKTRQHQKTSKKINNFLKNQITAHKSKHKKIKTPPEKSPVKPKKLINLNKYNIVIEKKNSNDVKLSRHKIKNLFSDKKLKSKISKKINELKKRYLFSHDKEKQFIKKEKKVKLNPRIISKIKIDLNNIKKIKEKIHSYKFCFSYIRKCSAFNFIYLGNKDKKLTALMIAENENGELIFKENLELSDNNGKNIEGELLSGVDTVKLLEKNEKIINKKIFGEDLLSAFDTVKLLEKNENIPNIKIEKNIEEEILFGDKVKMLEKNVYLENIINEKNIEEELLSGIDTVKLLEQNASITNWKDEKKEEKFFSELDTVKLLEKNKKIIEEKNIGKEPKEDIKAEEDIKKKIEEKDKNIINQIEIDLNNNSKNKEENNTQQEKILEQKISTLKISINLLTNSIHKNIQISYPEIKQTHEIKIESPICDLCFRLIYIFFDYIQDYVTTYCPYCNKILVYKYDIFSNYLSENKSPILDTCCQKCYQSFLYSEINNIFNLIEQKDKKFLVICTKCLENNINSKINFEKDRIIPFEDLLEQKPYIYEENNNNKIKDKNFGLNNNNIINNEAENGNEINNGGDEKNNNINNNVDNNNEISNIFEKDAEEENKQITDFSYLLKGFESNLNLFEEKIKDIPFSLKEQLDKKIKQLKSDLFLKKLIHNYYTNFNNFVTRANMLSSINSIIDLSSLKLYRLFNDLYKPTLDEKCQMIKKLINSNRIYKRVKLPSIQKYYTYSKLTKNYSNEEDFIEDKNEAREEKLNISYIDILNINFITGEAIRYNILSEALFCEKIVPLSYTYNIFNSINYQGIILYNLKQDNKIYYAEYNIKFGDIEENTLMKILNFPIKRCIKIILINNGNDLFILGKKNANLFDKNLNAYYICNFRIKPIVTEYIVHGEYNIIFNNYTVCIQTKKKLMFMNRTLKKDMNICSGYDQIDNIDINNLGQNFVGDDNNSNGDDNNNNIQNNINEMIEFQENLMNAFGGDMDLIIENLDNLDELNNNLPNLPPLHSSSIFQLNEEGIKSCFLNILDINQKYFVVLSSKTIRKNNRPLKVSYYLSLFDFDNLEEITKMEIDIIEIEETDDIKIDLISENEVKLTIKMIIYKNQNILNLVEKKYNYILDKGELLENNK